MKLVIILINFTIYCLLYLPFGLIFLPFRILKPLCDLVHYLNNKLVGFLDDVFYG